MSIRSVFDSLSLCQIDAAVGIETDSVIFRFQLAKDSVFTLSSRGVSIPFLSVLLLKFGCDVINDCFDSFGGI